MAEHRYKVLRPIEDGPLKQELYLPFSKMIPGDYVTIVTPNIGTIVLSETPNGRLKGMTWAGRVWQSGGSLQDLPTESMHPDKRGRIVQGDCPPSRAGYSSYTPPSNPRRKPTSWGKRKESRK